MSICTEHNSVYTHYVDGTDKDFPTFVMNAQPGQGSRDQGLTVLTFQELMTCSRSHVQPMASIQVLWLLCQYFFITSNKFGYLTLQS